MLVAGSGPRHSAVSCQRSNMENEDEMGRWFRSTALCCELSMQQERKGIWDLRVERRMKTLIRKRERGLGICFFFFLFLENKKILIHQAF